MRFILGYIVPASLGLPCALFKGVDAASSYLAARGAAAWCVCAKLRMYPYWPMPSKHAIVQFGYPQNGCEGVRILLASPPTRASAPCCRLCEGRCCPGSVAVDLVQSACKSTSTSPGTNVDTRLKCLSFEAYRPCEPGRPAHPGARGDRGPDSGFKPGPDEVVE